MALLQKAYLGSTPLFRDVPWFEDIRNVTITGQATTTPTPAAGATAHTKGAWVQLIASTSGDSNLFTSIWQSASVSATDTAMVMDIGVGASGSETVVAPDIALGGTSSNAVILPINIPSGSRIAARIAGVRGSSQTITSFSNITTYNISSTATSLLTSSVDVLGVSTASSTGTAMSGASGTWVEIIASTSKDYIAFSIVPSISDTDTATIGDLRLTLGVGAAGSESVIGEIAANTTTSEAVSLRSNAIAATLFGREVPAGSRLAIRHNITANPGKYDACIIAVPKP